MKDRPNGMRFWWTELLLSVEFKVIYKKLSRPASEDLVRVRVTRDRSLSTFIAGSPHPSFIRLSIYDSGGSVDCELSGQSTVYTSPTEHVTQ
jgi:hypothetical protein